MKIKEHSNGTHWMKPVETKIDHFNDPN
jgi:hypothetical protein